MTKDEALTMALEALEEATTYTSSASFSPSMTRDCEKAITAIHEALAQPAAQAEPQDAKDAELLAKQFHETYERLAPAFGYVTSEATRQFHPTSPNGKLMIAVCKELAARGVGGAE